MVAFTGGNGPALTAYLLNNLFDGSVVGCIGDTTQLPREQVEHASFVADLLGKALPLPQRWPIQLTKHCPLVRSSLAREPSTRTVGYHNGC